MTGEDKIIFGVEDTKYFLKREPLSEEAVGELLMGGFSTHLMDLVRMIEKAHGIGV